MICSGFITKWLKQIGICKWQIIATRFFHTPITNLVLDDIDVIAIPYDPIEKEEYAKKVVEAIDSTAKKVPELIYEDHHFAHICDSVFQSGFDHCACLVVDGMGDSKDSITLAHYKDGKIEILEKYLASTSVGLLYAGATGALNLGEFGEGKVMGLAPYGKPVETMPLYWEDNQIKSILPNYLDTENVGMDQFNKYSRIFERYCVKNCYPYR